MPEELKEKDDLVSDTTLLGRSTHHHPNMKCVLCNYFDESQVHDDMWVLNLKPLITATGGTGTATLRCVGLL